MHEVESEQEKLAEQTVFEDGFIIGAKLVEAMIDAVFDLFGGNDLGLPEVTFDEEMEAGKTDAWNLYRDGGKEAVLAHFNKRLEALKKK